MWEFFCNFAPKFVVRIHANAKKDMQERQDIIQENEFVIPVDYTVEEFMKHLWAHPRTILSAKYGDGKSYFLKKFEEHNEAQNHFVFLKLFPVNYQVVENRDIFELIKYDLIFQLYEKGMLKCEDKKISTSVLLYHYIISHKLELSKFLCEVGGLVGVLPEQLGKMIESGSKLMTDWTKYRKEYGDGNAAIDKFYEKIDRHYLYEADAITAFIKETIAAYKTHNPDKKVVLVIEDMDRLDPAHLFRILNVLSAQVDYAYRYGVSPDGMSVTGNKFGVDNVLLVMDYDNTQKIYQHFYGENTNFEGYINKFISHNIFRYSLMQEKYKYFSEYLNKVTRVRMNVLQEVVPEIVFDGKTIREIGAAIKDTEEQLFFVPQYSDINHSVELPKEILRLMVVLRRLGLKDNEIAVQIERAIINQPQEMMYYLGGYWLQYRHRMLSESFFMKSRERNEIYQIHIYDILENGCARVECNEYGQIGQIKLENMQEFAKYLMQYIAA